MSKPTVLSQRATQGIEIDQWGEFFTEFTQENRGAHARLEVLGRDVGYQVETENRPFDGISADVRNGMRIVWITFGSTPDDHIAHGVHNVTVIRTLPATKGKGPVLEAESEDGTRTLLELTNPLDYALPPATV
jgi:hypothetical protein